MRFSPKLQLIISPLLAAIIIVLCWLAASLIQHLADARLQETQRAQLTELRGKLEGELNSAINLTAGLVAYVSVHGDIDQQTFNEISRYLLAEQSLVRNITLAPNNVIRYLYPIQGNEAALDLNLLTHQIQGRSTQRMIEQRAPILTAPVQLVQGGRALIHRVPIYVDGTDQAAGDYWGLMSTPIDFDALLQKAELTRLSQDMPLAIRGVDAGGKPLEMIYGNPGLFNQPDRLMSSVKALDGSWQLVTRPMRDDSAFTRWLTAWLKLGGILVGMLLGLFSWRIGRQAQRLQASEQLYRELAEHMKDVVFQTDTQRRITYLNPAWEKLTGRAISDCLGSEWINLLDPRDQSRASSRCGQLISQSDAGEDYAEELRVQRKDGPPLWMVIRVALHRDTAGKVLGSIGTMVDISERKAIEDKVHHLAMHDNLTGLPNRRLLQDLFNHAQARLQRQNSQNVGDIEKGAEIETDISFLFLDLDGFKAINDHFGHDQGDRLLQSVVARLQVQLRKVDTLTRLGGDEFAVLLDHQSDREEAIKVAEKLLEVMGEPFIVQGEACSLSVSIGIAFYPRHGSNLDELISAADSAMYRAKNAGKGCWRIAD